jgi:hypothetical protein
MSTPSVYMVGSHIIGTGGGVCATGSSSGFFADPYSSYNTFWVDALNGSDSNSGNSQLNAKQTLAAGIALLSAGGGNRLMVVPTATYSIPVNTTLTLPSYSGATSSARVVIQGLPSASVCPQIVYGLNSYFYVNQNGTRDYAVFRKLDISGSGTSGSPNTTVAPGLLTWLSNAVCASPLVQFCKLHDNWSTDITCGIRIEGAHTNTEFSYNHIYNMGNNGNADNAAGMLTYQTPNIWFHNNDVVNCGALVFFKRCPPSTSNNGPIVENNYFHNGAGQTYNVDGVLFSEQGAGDTDAFFNSTVRYNLFEGMQLACIRQVNDQNTLQSDIFLSNNNTYANCSEAESFRAMTNISRNSSIYMMTVPGSNGAFILEMQAPGGGYANSVAQSDYNSIYTGSGVNYFWQRFGTGTTSWSSQSTWQSGAPGVVTGISSTPDTHSQTFASILTNFPNSGSGGIAGWGLASGSSLKGTGLGGIDPGYNPANCGPGWS